MKFRLNKVIKILCAIIIVFLVINIFSVLPVSADNAADRLKKNQGIATFIKVAVVTTQILVTGFFTIRITILGIQYFTTASYTPAEKNEVRNMMHKTLGYAVLAFVTLSFFSYAFGL